MIGGMFIYSRKGELLVSRVYRDSDVSRPDVEKFQINVIQSSHQIRLPISKIGRSTFLHIEKEDLWICAVTKQNANEALIFEFLNRFCEAMEAYFGKFDAEKLQKEILIVDELLDEMVDYGYPQLTDSGALMTFISKHGIVAAPPAKQKEITSQVTGHVIWRPQGIKYWKNELFVDLIERIDLIMSKEGEVMSSQVSGHVMIKSKLSGMPECTLGINEQMQIPGMGPFCTSAEFNGALPTVKMDDCQFHQCVKLSKYENDHMITFIPPDGEFQLMRYRITKDIKLPFRVTPSVRAKENRKLEVKVSVKSIFATFLPAQSIRIVIPMPPRTTSVKLSYEKGKAKYKSAANRVVWKIDKMAGEKEAEITAEIDAVAVGVDTWNRPPISMSFELPYTPSGLKVRYVKVCESKSLFSNEDVIKWVRYIGQAGEYDTRF